MGRRTDPPRFEGGGPPVGWWRVSLELLWSSLGRYRRVPPSSRHERGDRARHRVGIAQIFLDSANDGRARITRSAGRKRVADMFRREMPNRGQGGAPSRASASNRGLWSR